MSREVSYIQFYQDKFTNKGHTTTCPAGVAFGQAMPNQPFHPLTKMRLFQTPRNKSVTFHDMTWMTWLVTMSRTHMSCDREEERLLDGGGCPSWMAKLSLSELSAYIREGGGGHQLIIPGLLLRTLRPTVSHTQTQEGRHWNIIRVTLHLQSYGQLHQQLNINIA